MNELGAGTRGASMAFDALEMAAIKFGKHLFNEIPIKEVTSHNSELYHPIQHPFAKHIEGINKIHEEVANLIAAELKNDKMPFVISGDHSNGAATIAGIKKAYPDKNLGVIWIDAHGDLHSPYTTPSGNVHGMPLSIALGSDNLSKQKNYPDKDTVSAWDSLKNTAGDSPKINADHVVFFAVRDTESSEDYFIEKNQIRNFKVEEIRHKGIEFCVSESFKRLEQCEIIYISFDVDSMDCNLVSRGTGTPVENGLSSEEAEKLVLRLMDDERLVCFEMVEINPLLDNKGNKMAETSVRILDKTINKYMSRL